MKRGMYPDLPFDEYMKSPGLNQSHLKKILLSEKSFHMAADPNRVKTTTKSQKKGHELHSYLETMSYDQFFVIPPEINKRTNAGKDEIKKIVEENKGKTIIEQADLELIKEIDKSIKAHKGISLILEKSQREVSAFGRINGIDCKCRYDLLFQQADIMADIKTTRRNNRFLFEKDCVEFGYNFQAAFYDRLYFELTGSYLKKIYLIIIETTPPFECLLYKPDEYFMEYGRREVATAFEKYKAYIERDSFLPRQADGQPEPLSIPVYLRRTLDD